MSTFLGQILSIKIKSSYQAPTIHSAAADTIVSATTSRKKRWPATPTARARKPSELQVRDVVLLKNTTRLRYKLTPAYFPQVLTLTRKKGSMRSQCQINPQQLLFSPLLRRGPDLLGRRLPGNERCPCGARKQRGRSPNGRRR